MRTHLDVFETKRARWMDPEWKQERAACGARFGAKTTEDFKEVTCMSCRHTGAYRRDCYEAQRKRCAAGEHEWRLVPLDYDVILNECRHCFMPKP